MVKRFLLTCTLALASVATIAQVGIDPYKEIRYCGPPKRDPVTHEILRDAKVISSYRKVHACPSTGKFTGACPDYALNHVKPLACGGCDAVWNLTWMRNDIKALQDRVERNIYALSPPVPDTPQCVMKLSPMPHPAASAASAAK